MLEDKFILRTTFLGQEYSFPFKVISFEEEKEYTAKMIKIGDNKPDEEYEFLVNTAANWLVDFPSFSDKEQEDEKTPRESFLKFFNGKSATKVRFINGIVIQYRKALTPTADFL